MGGIILGGVVITQDEAPAGTANIHTVASGAGSCTRSVTPIDYATAVSNAWTCGSFDAANDICQNGDTVGVRGGSYGNVVISGSNGRTSMCTFTVASDQNVTMTGFDNGHQTGGDTGADWLTIQTDDTCRIETTTCPITLHGEFDSDNNSNNVFEGFDIDGDDTAEQQFHVESTDGPMTFRDMRIHDATDTNGMSILTGDGPWIFEDMDWYDVQDTTGGAIHSECAWTAMNNVTLRRTRWMNCTTQGIFLTGNEQATNWLVENNVFQAPVDSVNEAAFAFRSGDPPSPSPDGFIFRYNTIDSGVQINGTDNSPTANGFTVYGNYFRVNTPCGLSNTTCSYNVTPTGVGNGGGTGAASFSLASLNAGFTDPETGEANGNYALVSGSPLINIGNGSDYPSLDALGVARFDGSAPDIGAYEFQE